MRSPSRSDRGIAAVEFALVAPLILALVLGAVEFGERFSQKATYNNAAQVAARNYSFNNSATLATTAARQAGLPTTVTPTYTFTYDSGASASSCSANASGDYPNVKVVVTRTAIPNVTTLAQILPGVGSSYSVTGQAVARCAV